MKHLITLFLVLSSFCVFSQTQISKKDKKTYNAFLDELDDGNVDNTMLLADSTYNAALEYNNKILEVLMLEVLATGNYRRANFSKSSALFLKGYNVILDLDKSYLRDSLLVSNLSLQGIVYSNYGDYSKATKRYHESLTIAKKNNDSILIGKAYNYLGVVYGKNQLYDDAIYYYNECIKYDKSIETKNIINSNLGNIYAIRKNFKLAEKYLIETLKTSDSSNYDLSVSNSNLAFLYSDMRDYEKAHKLFLLADKYASETNDKSDQLESKLKLIMSSTDIKDYASAKKYMEICDSLAKETESNSLKMFTYLSIYKNSAKMKDYKAAFENAEKYMAIHDTIFSIEKTEIIKDLKIKHESDLKETEIVGQKKIIESQSKQKTGLIIGLTIVLISMLFMFFSHKKRLLAQKELANEKMNTALEKEKVKTYLSYIEGQNKERTRMSQELHSGILGRLFATRIGLSFLQCKDTETTNQKLFVDELQHIEKEIRSLSLKLSDEVEETELNFHNTVNQLLKETGATGNFDVLLNNSDKINWDSVSELIKINLYRILEESLQNIIKHTNASKVVLDFHLKNHKLLIDINDNGKGFSKEKIDGDIDMKNIASRVKDIKGALKIESEENKGTIINISIPYKSAV